MAKTDRPWPRERKKSTCYSFRERRVPVLPASFSDTIDGVNKDRTVEKSLKSLDEQIEKWKADNGVTGPVTVAAEKPQPQPFWRSSVPSHALLPPDVVSDSA